MKKLAIITTHPVQYYAPLFQLLAGRGNIQLKVFYTWGKASVDKHDPGFGRTVEWDIPLLDGYEFEWQENTSAQPGSHHFKGIVCPHLIARVKAYQPDALLVFGWAYHAHLKVMRYFKKKMPVYFRGDSTLLDEQKSPKALLKTFFLTWVYQHIDHAFYAGQNNRAYFKKYGLKDHQLTFAPHAVDNARFADDRHSEADHLRKQNGIGEQDILVVFAGKFESKKSPQLLLQAFISLNKPGTHLLFAGDGPLKASLQQQAGDHPHVHFLPFQNQYEIPIVYQAADLFCLPSGGPGETWGLAVNEAMACSKAILVSNRVGCAPDLVVPGQNGDIFLSGDINSLIRCLNDLATSKQKLKEYGTNSAAKISQWSFLNSAMAIEEKVSNG